MKYAKELLNSNFLSIEEIANQCGFNMLTSFSRVFKEEFGHSPSEHRKKLLGKMAKLEEWKIPFSENDYNQLLQLKFRNKWLAKLFVIVIDNLDNELFSIEELADKLFVSPSNLNRKMQKMFGITTTRLVRDLRLQYAAELLSIKKKSVTEAACLAGFFDASHLSRYFTKNFGCTPNEYRNKEQCFPCINGLKTNESNC